MLIEYDCKCSGYYKFVFQVDEVIGIMHKNVENVLERDRKLGDLEERADALQDGCAQFEKQVFECTSIGYICVPRLLINAPMRVTKNLH